MEQNNTKGKDYGLYIEGHYKARSVPIPPHALHLVKELEE